MERLRAAEKAIKNGWIAALVSMGFTLLIVVLALSGVFDMSAEMGSAIDMLALIDVALIGVLAFFIYRKSRVAAVLMLLYFAYSKYLQISAGQTGGLVMGAVFLWFYARAVWGTFVWHQLADDAVPVEVFSDTPTRPMPADTRLFR